MRTIILSSAPFLFLFTLPANAQQLTMEAGSHLNVKSNAVLIIENGNFTNNSDSISFNNSYLYMTGSNNNVIGGSGKNIFKDISVDKSSALLSLTGDISIINRLTMVNGNLNLNKHNIFLSSKASIQGETNNKHIVGPGGGEIQMTLTMNSPVLKNPGNLGAIITSSANLGTVTITRGHKVQTNSGPGKSIKRYYTIVTANNTALNATLRFNYFNGELNGIIEGDLSIWRSTNGTTWTNKGFTTRDANANYVELTGINTLGAGFTLSSSNFSLPMENSQIGTKVKNPESSKLLTLQIIPNPVTNQQAQIKINSNSSVTASLIINTVDGRKIMQSSILLLEGLNELPLNAGKLLTGSYFITLISDDGETRTVLFIKE